MVLHTIGSGFESLASYSLVVSTLAYAGTNYGLAMLCVERGVYRVACNDA